MEVPGTVDHVRRFLLDEYFAKVAECGALVWCGVCGLSFESWSL